MARSMCSQCSYPIQTCVCDSISKVDTIYKIIIIQDRRERHHAKNTVRLLKLLIPDIVITITNIENIAEQNQNVNRGNSALVYPSSNSVAIESEASIQGFLSNVENLIFIDGSWKQAFAIFQSNPWLQTLNSVHFENAPCTKYQIRKTDSDIHLSTLEAVSYSLNVLSNTTSTAFQAALNRLNHNWHKYQS